MSTTNGFVRVNRHHPCPICGRFDERCCKAPEGRFDICYRQGGPGATEKTDSSGSTYWVHRNGDSPEAKPEPRPNTRPAPVRGDPDTLHAIYSALLEGLTLESRHEDDMDCRGFGRGAACALGYRSKNDHLPRGLVDDLADRFGVQPVLSVPGFFRDTRGLPAFDCLPGVLIPCRDPFGRIVGLQVRVDSEVDADSKYLWVTSNGYGGPSPGTPIHVPLQTAALDTATVRITEGFIKADLATALSGMPTIGVPGVTIWKESVSTLKELRATEVRVAYDSDWTRKPQVSQAYLALIKELKSNGFKIGREDWDEADGKGIDDLLANGFAPRLITGPNALSGVAAGCPDGTADQDKPQSWECSLVLDVGDWLDREITYKYDIDDILGHGQPCVLGGPRKGLKTTASLDMGVSLSCGVPFLGKFNVPEPIRVMILSAESGDATIHETLRRICQHKKCCPRNGWLVPGFQIPKFSDPTHAERFAEILVDLKIGVAIIDPLYLALSCEGGDLNPADMFAMGRALKLIVNACVKAGATPVINHHFRRSNIADPYEPPDLELLSHAGVTEYARQWILLGRREKYVPMSGKHALWLVSGGPAGHGGLWGLNINEPGGFGTRSYEAEVVTLGDVKQEQTVSKEAKAREKEIKEKADRIAKLKNDADEALAKLKSIGGRKTQEQWATALGWAKSRLGTAIYHLQEKNSIHPCNVDVPCGAGKRSVPGWDYSGAGL